MALSVIMSESKNQNLTSISKAQTLEEIGDFWDEHSLADYWDQTHEVEFEVRAQHRRRVTLEPDLCRRIEEQARTSSHGLVALIGAGVTLADCGGLPRPPQQ